jgi:hypothetical protein
MLENVCAHMACSFHHALFTRPPYTRRGNHVCKTLLFSFGGVVSFLSKAITVMHPIFLLALLFPFQGNVRALF